MILSQKSHENKITTKPTEKRNAGKPKTSRSVLKTPAYTSKATDKESNCIIGNELYQELPIENQIETHLCREWSHEKCAGLQIDDVGFIFEYCVL